MATQLTTSEFTTLWCGLSGSPLLKFGVTANTPSSVALSRAMPSGSGTITVIFTDNDDALGQRMLDNVMLTSQEGARVRLFVNTVSDGASTPALI